MPNGNGKKKRRTAENDPIPIDPKEGEIKVPAHVPAKFREDWIKHRKQIEEYGKKSGRASSPKQMAAREKRLTGKPV